MSGSVAVITPAIKADKYINMLKWFSKLVQKYSAPGDEENLVVQKINSFCESELKKGKTVLTEQMNDALLYLLLDKTGTKGIVKEMIRLYQADDTSRREAVDTLLSNITYIQEILAETKQIIETNKEDLIAEIKVAGIYSYILFGNLIEIVE